jgi:hypothetical protein
MHRRFHDLPGRGGLNPWPATSASLVAHRVRAPAEFSALHRGNYAAVNLGTTDTALADVPSGSPTTAPTSTPGAPTPPALRGIEITPTHVQRPSGGSDDESGTGGEDFGGGEARVTFAIEVDGLMFDVSFAGCAQASSTADEVCARFGLPERECGGVRAEFEALCSYAGGRSM